MPARNIYLPLKVKQPALRVAPGKAGIPQEGSLYFLDIVFAVDAIANLDGWYGRSSLRQAGPEGGAKQHRGQCCVPYAPCRE
ncbi:hypothetical protein AWV80_10060 [Cupriavidus sp. UYMU48A]|nr:hypothetical protein AWV80_10060 [Cupriavidus sp. UYMU48A]